MVVVWDSNSKKKTRTPTRSSENKVFSEQGSTLSTPRSCPLYAFWEFEGFHDVSRNLHLKTDSAADTAGVNSCHVMFILIPWPPPSLNEKMLVSLTLLEVIATGNQIIPSPLPWVNKCFENWKDLGWRRYTTQQIIKQGSGGFKSFLIHECSLSK